MTQVAWDIWKGFINLFILKLFIGWNKCWYLIHTTCIIIQPASSYNLHHHTTCIIIQQPASSYNSLYHHTTCIIIQPTSSYSLHHHTTACIIIQPASSYNLHHHTTCIIIQPASSYNSLHHFLLTCYWRCCYLTQAARDSWTDFSSCWDHQGVVDRWVPRAVTSPVSPCNAPQAMLRTVHLWNRMKQ